MTRFDRDGLEFGLRQLVTKLRSSGSRSGLRIVGGAALALRYFDRESTVDIDAHPIGDADHVLGAGREVELYESFYSSEVLPDRAISMVTKILAVGLPEAPPTPPAPDLGVAGRLG